MRLGWGWCILFAGTLVGCTSPVATGLDEHDANEVVSLFARHGIASDKDGDPEHENAYRVSVGRGDSPSALGLLAEAELPRPKPRGLGDFFDGKTLVPTALHERAQMTAGISGDLERTLLAVDGVRVARVHLAMPDAPIGKEGRARVTASVLLEHRGSVPPMTMEAVQRLVAGATNGLSPEDVSVVTLSRPKAPEGSASDVASLGPISVSRGSMRTLQVLLAGAFALALVFAGLFTATYLRLLRANRERRSLPE